MSHLDDDNMLAMYAPSPHDIGEAVSLIAQVVGLMKTVYDWWKSDQSASHVNASLRALDAILESKPNLRAQLAEQARQDPATAEQLRSLATDDHPGLMAVLKEI